MEKSIQFYSFEFFKKYINKYILSLKQQTNCSTYSYFYLKMNFIKIKIRGTTFNGLDLDKYYPGHNHKQHLKGFSRRAGQTSWVMLMPMIDVATFLMI